MIGFSPMLYRDAMFDLILSKYPENPNERDNDSMEIILDSIENDLSINKIKVELHDMLMGEFIYTTHDGNTHSSDPNDVYMNFIVSSSNKDNITEFMNKLSDASYFGEGEFEITEAGTYQTKIVFMGYPANTTKVEN